MKVSLWNQTVRPPSTTTSARLTHSIRSIFLPRSFRNATCASVAKITTTVASSTGASSGPTTPPATMPPRCCDGERGGPGLVGLGVFEGAEEQDDRQEVEQQFHERRECSVAASGATAEAAQRLGLKSIDAELMQ